MDNPALYRDEQFDPVHDGQRIFKNLMMALAFPGSVRQLLPIPFANISASLGYALQPLLTLLDLETGFHIHTRNARLQKEVEDFLEINTSAVACGPESADFILSLESTARHFFSSIRKGSLFNPDQGATILYQVDTITSSQYPGPETLTIEGPGIRERTFVETTGLDPEEPLMWESIRDVYPMGVDVFLISREGGIMGIPRSVNIMEPGAF